MYTSVDYKFDVRFNSGIVINVNIPQNEVAYIKVSEYFKNKSTPIVIDSSNVVDGDEYTFYRNWYSRYQIDCYRFDNNLGIIHVKTIHYNELNKPILFRLETPLIEEFKFWSDIIQTESAVRGFIPTIVHFDEPYDYKMYYNVFNIGRFDQDGSLQEHGYPNNWWGSFRYFWSWNQPRDWKYLNSKEIVEDIIGIAERNPNFKGFIL